MIWQTSMQFDFEFDFDNKRGKKSIIMSNVISRLLAIKIIIMKCIFDDCIVIRSCSVSLICLLFIFEWCIIQFI